MIKINLLPEEMKKKPVKAAAAVPFAGKFPFLSRFSLKTWLIIAGSGAIGLILVMLLLILFVPTAVFQSRLKDIEERSTAIRKDVELAARMEGEEEGLKKVVGSMEKLAKDRMLWAAVLNDLSDSTPSEIRLTKLYNKIEEIKVEAPKKEAVKPKKSKKEEAAAAADAKKEKGKEEKKPKRAKKTAAQKKIMRYLMIEGMVEAGRDEGVVNGFIEKLKETKYFSTHFSDISLVGVSILPDGKKAGTIRCHYKEKKHENPDTQAESQ